MVQLLMLLLLTLLLVVCMDSAGHGFAWGCKLGLFI